MLVLLGSVVVFAIAIWAINRKYGPDAPESILNLTTKIESNTKEVVKDVVSVLDVNNDGKVNLADAKAAAKKVKKVVTKTKKAAPKRSTKVKKPKTKKPKA